MSNIVHNNRKIFINGNNGIPSSVTTRITNLENNVNEVTYFAQVSSGTSGTITIPTGATILQGTLPGNLNVLTSKISGGQITDSTPTTAGGALVTGTLDTSGNYTLSGTPSAYPIALIYQLTITSVNWSNLTTANIIEYYQTNVITSILGTTNQIDVSTANPPVISIDSGYIGQSSITTLGTITTGTLGSGIKILLGSDATGDLYYNGGSGALTRLGAGTSTNVLTSNGAGMAPSWQAASGGSSTYAFSSLTITGGGTTTITGGSTAFVNLSASSNATSTTFAYSGFANGELATIHYLKTTATDLVITFPSGTELSQSALTAGTISGLTLTLHSTTSGSFTLWIQYDNIAGTYFVTGVQNTL